MPLGRNYASAVAMTRASDRSGHPGPGPRLQHLRRHVDREPVSRRRRQHDQRHPRLPGERAVAGVRRGSADQDGRLRGRVRPRDGRHHQRRHEVGRQYRSPGDAFGYFQNKSLTADRKATRRPTRSSPDLRTASTPRSRARKTTASTSEATRSRTVCGSSAPTTA